MLAPIVAEVHDPLFPYVFCVVTAAMGLFATTMLKKKPEENPEGLLNLSPI